MDVTPAAFLDRLDRSAGHHRTPCGDGGSLAWRGWGQGPALVLLHGWAGSWRHWARNIEPLSRQYRLLAVDLPGQGDSDATTGAASRSEAARAVMRGAREILGAEAR